MMGNAILNKGKLDGDIIKLNIEMLEGGQEGVGGPGEITLKKV